MPPASFVGVAAATIGAQSYTFLTPVATAPRDTVLAILGTDAVNAGPDLSASELAGWELLGSFGAGPANGRVFILRREAEVGDASTVTIPMLDALAWGVGALLVYRNLDPGAAIVASGFTAVIAATNFPGSNLTLASYSDLYLGIVLVTSAAVAVTPPAAGVERFDGASGARELEIFEVLREAPGLVGAQVATTAANQTGVVAAIALAADPIVGFGKSFAFDPIGGIGLPSEGV